MKFCKICGDKICRRSKCRRPLYRLVECDMCYIGFNTICKRCIEDEFVHCSIECMYNLAYKMLLPQFYDYSTGITFTNSQINDQLNNFSIIESKNRNIIQFSRIYLQKYVIKDIANIIIEY